jgi:5-methylcytosine-specific restriction endonuclease McrA
VSDYNRAYRTGPHREKLLEGKKRYYQENREKCDEVNKAWKEANIEKTRSYGVKWAKRNPARHNFNMAKRRAMLRNQTPELTPEEQKRIEDIYWLARDLSAVTGEPYEVDHIHPIVKGGLHHLDNLQILPMDLNRSKGAK